MNRSFNIESISGWALYRPDGSVISVHPTEAEAKFAAAKRERPVAPPPATPEAYPVDVE